VAFIGSEASSEAWHRGMLNTIEAHKDQDRTAKIPPLSHTDINQVISLS
jgi:hypothetical protein